MNIKTPIKIIIIDDDQALQRVFTRILQKEGYQVETAETGSESIEKIRKNNFDVALIDMKLPDINGLDLLPLLKEAKPSMVKIMITGYAIIDGKTSALELGADDFFKKPIQPPVLLEAIKTHLKTKVKDAKGKPL
ncbi:MAG: response regulator [Candidatus Bathyarchaeia archaeon]|jgi:DNA-binding NtrC family response regulator